VDNCDKIQQMIIEAYVSKQSIPETIKNHVAQCASCQDFSREYSGVFDFLESAKDPVLPDLLAEETMKRIEKQAIQANERKCWWKITFAAIATLPIVLGIHLFWIIVIESSVSFVFPSIAIIARYLMILMSFFGLSIIYGSIPLVVGKYLSLQRE
jgi:hypothetical protein